MNQHPIASTDRIPDIRAVDRAACRPIANRSNHTCFGCSPGNDHGLRMTFASDGQAVYSWLIVPPHLCGWDDIVHGGVVTTILDEIMSWSAIYLLDRFILTKSITIDFLKPAMTGKELTAAGRLLEVVSEREAVMEGFLFREDGALCARTHGTFALFTPEAIKKTGLFSADQVDAMASLMAAHAEERKKGE